MNKYFHAIDIFYIGNINKFNKVKSVKWDERTKDLFRSVLIFKLPSFNRFSMDMNENDKYDMSDL